MSALLEWLKQNPEVAQAIAAIAIVFLTAALISITGYYAWVTRKTLQVFQKEFAFRVRPFLQGAIRVARLTEGPNAGSVWATLVLNAYGAPAKLTAASAMILNRDASSEKSFIIDAVLYPHAEGRIVTPGSPQEFHHLVQSEYIDAYFRARIDYSDAEGIRHYYQEFDKLGIESEGPTSPLSIPYPIDLLLRAHKAQPRDKTDGPQITIKVADGESDEGDREKD